MARGARRDLILILDFGAQYTQLIARRVREQKVYSEIHPFNLPLARIRELAPRGIILSGGPSSSYDEGRAARQRRALRSRRAGPGHLLRRAADGAAAGRQGGRRPSGASTAARRCGSRTPAICSTASRPARRSAGLDEPRRPRRGAARRLRGRGRERELPGGGGRGAARKFWGVQFHPEVAHTPRGGEILAQLPVPHLRLRAELDDGQLRRRGGGDRQTPGRRDGRAVCGLSGGVDSSVAAALVLRAIGDRLTCIFVDTGLQRAGEAAQVESMFRDAFKADLRVVDAERAVPRRAGRRHRPRAEAQDHRPRVHRGVRGGGQASDRRRGLPGAGHALPRRHRVGVAQGRRRRPSRRHHNVGGLPERMKLKLVEPLRELFKDEVRALGAELGLPRHVLWRQPFPGPGLAVRILGEVTKRAATSCAPPTRSSRRRSAPPGSTNRSGSRSACCCRCARSA